MLGNISEISTKAPCEAALIHERHMRIEISDFVMRAFVPIQRKDSSHAVFFSFWQRLYFPKVWFPSILYAGRAERMSAALRLLLRFVWVDGDMEVVNREVVQVFCGFFVVFILRFGDGLYIFFKIVTVAVYEVVQHRLLEVIAR